jgi:hypothetical protein
MTTTEILHEIDLQISRLSAARALLRNDPSPAPASILVSSGGTVTSHPVTFPMPSFSAPPPPLRPLDPIPLLLSSKSAGYALGRPSRPVRREMSPAARERISLAQKRRWRAFHREQKRAVKTLMQKPPIKGAA